MTTGLWALALFLQLGFFAMIARESIRHFVQAPATGHRVIQIASPVATALLAGLSVWGGTQPVPMSVLAITLSGGGFLLFRSAIIASAPGNLGVAFSARTSEKLLQTGIYGVVRNPLYTSYLVYWSAWVMLLNFAVSAVLTALFFSVVYWIAACREEAALSESFGQTYAAYRARTGRFIPHLGHNPGG